MYIDGYNWYHAIFKKRPDLKWLNVQSFFEYLRGRDEIVRVKMFSALIDPDNPTSDARERQERYFRAIKTLPKVSVILGHFQKREVTCGECKVKYKVPEEKKTDVNIAVEMISDAVNGQAETMYVVSGDSDVQPVVEWIVKNRPQIKIFSYIPAIPNEQSERRLDYYRTKNMPVECSFLPLDDLKNHQLKSIVKLPDGTLASKPHVWT